MENQAHCLLKILFLTVRILSIFLFIENGSHSLKCKSEVHKSRICSKMLHCIFFSAVVVWCVYLCVCVFLFGVKVTHKSRPVCSCASILMIDLFKVHVSMVSHASPLE